MQNDKEQIVIIIIAVITVLLFIGIMFLILIWAYSQKRKQMEIDKQKIRDNFDKQLLQSKLEIQEETFNAISQEIHDNVGQMLSLAKVQLNIIEQKTPLVIPGLEEVKDSISTALTDLRSIARSLSSERIQLLSLPDCIREEVARLNKSGLPFKFTLEGQEKIIGKQEKLFLFRIIQEALQNIMKHANATEVNILFHYMPEHLKIIIADNGSGFHVNEELNNLSGLGLRNIVNRTALIGGEATISSSINKGTAVTIHHPYTLA